MTKPLAGHSYGGLKGEGNASPKDSYKSKIWPSHPTLRPKNNRVERKRGGTSVPVPPELNLP